MHEETAPDYIQLDSALTLAKSALLPAEVHGVVVGALCHHLKTGKKPDLMRLLAGGEQAVEADRPLEELCYRLYRTTMETLLQDDMQFGLYMPDDTRSVDERTESLAAWCQGYLLGLLHDDALSIDQFSGDCAEIIRDMMQISEATAGGQDEERDNWALAELEEYLRVAAQLVFDTIYAERAAAAPDTQQ